MIIDELLLDGAVEAFGAGVHFVRIIPDTNPLRGLRAISLPAKWWASGDRPPVGHAVGIEALLEASPELRAVVGEDETRRFRQQWAQHVKGDGSLLAGLGGGEGDSEAGVGVNEGEQAAAQSIAQAPRYATNRKFIRMSLQSIAQAHHGIAGEHFKRWMLEAFGLAGFGLAGDGFVAAAGIQSSGGVAHFVWVAGDDAADGGDTGQRDALLLAPWLQQDPQFGFAEVGELLAQLADFPSQHRWWLSPAPRERRIWQSGRPGRRRLGALFPAIQDSATDIEGITGRGCAMLVEETECFEALLSMFGSHLPKLP